MGGEVATLCVFDAFGGEGGNLTFVDVRAGVAVSGVALSARAEVAAQSVGTVGEDIARPILALVVIRHVAAFTPIAIVTVALTIQTGSVPTFTACRIAAVICKKS